MDMQLDGECENFGRELGQAPPEQLGSPAQPLLLKVVQPCGDLDETLHQGSLASVELAPRSFQSS